MGPASSPPEGWDSGTGWNTGSATRSTPNPTPNSSSRVGTRTCLRTQSSGTSGACPHLLHPVQLGRRLHQDGQGAGGRDEHAVPDASLPPEASPAAVWPIRLCCLPRALLRIPVWALQLLGLKDPVSAVIHLAQYQCDW